MPDRVPESGFPSWHSAIKATIIFMAKPADKTFFALRWPVPDTYIFKMLGRVMPLSQVRSPLSGPVQPEYPPQRRHSARDTGSSGNDEAAPAYEQDDDWTAAPAGADAPAPPGYRPPKTEKGVDLQALDRNLYPAKAITIRDVGIAKLRCAGHKSKLALEHVMGLRAQDHKTDLNATGFRKMDLQNPPERVAALLRHKEYAGPVVRFLEGQEDRKAAVVVGIITCAELPRAGAAAGVPAEATTYEELGGTLGGETIVACSYLTLSLVRPAAKFGMARKTLRRIAGMLEAPGEGDTRMEMAGEFLDPGSGSLYLSSQSVAGNVPVVPVYLVHRAPLDVRTKDWSDAGRALDFAILG